MDPSLSNNSLQAAGVAYINKKLKWPTSSSPNYNSFGSSYSSSYSSSSQTARSGQSNNSGKVQIQHSASCCTFYGNSDIKH
jgi:hypothetical protein